MKLFTNASLPTSSTAFKKVNILFDDIIRKITPNPIEPEEPVEVIDLAGKIRPALTVIDAVRILTNNGPTGGNLADVTKLDTLIVSPDIVAADSYAATLFGLQPEDLDYVRIGAQNRLGRSDLALLHIQEIDLAS